MTSVKISYLCVVTAVVFAMIGCSASASTEMREFKGTAAPNPVTPTTITVCGEDIDLDREDLFERYDRELTSFVYSHSSTLLMLKRANRYFPILAPILQEYGIPQDILYLACIESTLNPRAVSSAKAAGIWQFMPSTAKQYGLEVNDEVDERYNIEKATAAACRYLKSAYRKYGNWPSVMASYNAGQGRISTELEKQMQTNALDLYLNDETSRYFFRVAALSRIFDNPAAYGFRLYPEQFYMPVDCEVVEVDTPVDDWAVWASEHGITYAMLKDENPWIRDRKLTNKNGKTYKVRVPKKDSVYRSKNDIRLYNPNWAVETE